MTDRERQIEEIAKTLCVEFGTDTCATCYVAGGCANEFIAKYLYSAGYRKRDEVIKDVFEGLIEETKAVQRAGYDGLGVEDLKNIAKLWYGAEVEE